MQLHGLLIAFVAASLALNIALVLRRRGSRALGYAGLLAADLGLCGIALWRDQPGLAYFLALAVFLALMVVPALLGILIRGAVRRGDFGAALRFLDVRQLFQPGLGLDRERQMLAGLSLVYQGRGDEAIRVASKQLAEAPAEGSTRKLIVERLLALLVIEDRMAEAVALFEREGSVDLLSRAPSVGPTIVRAYGTLGDFEQLTACQQALEDSPAARDPALKPMLNAARLAFLAHLGRALELEALLSPGSAFMPGATGPRRGLWLGIALHRAGDREQARLLWMEVARQQDDPAAAELARRRLREDDDVTVPDPLAPAQIELLQLVLLRAGERQTQAPFAVPGGLSRQAPVTIVLLVAIAAVHVAIVGLGPGGEPDAWTLLRFGGNYVLLSLGEQPWRLVSSVFLHVGWLHLLLNGYALLTLGRFVEGVFGSWRVWWIFIGSGIAGAFVSARLGDGALSVGASGAVFGLLGAALVGLAALKGRAPDSWRKRLMMTLLIVLGLQVAIGFRSKMIDNAAHLGGLGAGLVLAYGLGWLDRLAGVLRWVARFALVSGGLALALGTLACLTLAARSRESSVLAAFPRKQVRDLGIELTVPAHFYVLDRRGGLTLQDPMLRPRTLQAFLPEVLPRTAEKESVREIGERSGQGLFRRLQADGRLRDVELLSRRSLSATLFAIDMKMTLGTRTIYQTLYFKRQKDVLLTMRTRLEPDHHASYQPLLDRVAFSLSLAKAGAPRRLPGFQPAPDPFASQPER